MSFYQVTSKELRAKADELRNLDGRFLSEMEKLTSYHDALSGMWEGDAKEGFSKVFMRDKTGMDNFKRAIDQYIEALIVIANRYEEAEMKNASLASR